MIAALLYICKKNKIQLDQGNIIAIVVAGIIGDIYIAYSLAKTISLAI